MRSLRQALHRFFTVAPPNIDVKNYRFYVVNHIAGTVGMATHFSWMVLFFFTNIDPLFYFNIGSVGLFVCFVLLNRRGNHLAAIILGVTEVIAHQLLGVRVLGWDAGFQYILIVASMLLFLMPKGYAAVKYTWGAMCILAFLFIEIYMRKGTPLYTIEGTVLATLNITNICISFLFLFTWAGFYNFAMFQTEKSLEERTAEVARAEKKAAVGTLTAGIAHEIQNPLNFVNNFSEISQELLEDIANAKTEEERNLLLGQLRENLAKINLHGKRADHIVKGMFVHLREREAGSQFGEKDEIIARDSPAKYSV
jgi:signal transduction histidine kinase